MAALRTEIEIIWPRRLWHVSNAAEYARYDGLRIIKAFNHLGVGVFAMRKAAGEKRWRLGGWRRQCLIVRSLYALCHRPSRSSTKVSSSRRLIRRMSSAWRHEHAGASPACFKPRVANRARCTSRINQIMSSLLKMRKLHRRPRRRRHALEA